MDPSRLAAVDDEGVAGGEGRFGRAPQQHGRGDLLGLAHAADRFLRDDASRFFCRGL
jgi:hypothetical protein